MSDTWTRIKEELSGVYRRARNAVANTVDTVKLKNRIAEQKEIIEGAQLEIGRIITDARRGMTDAMPCQLLLKENEAARIDELLLAIRASELEIEAMETELSILKKPEENESEETDEAPQDTEEGDS